MSKLEIETGQFMLDTMSFSPEIIGAYVLMMVAYRNKGPIPDEQWALQRIAKLEVSEDWEYARPVLAQLFEVRDGFWHHPGIDEQIAKTGRLRKNAAKASAAAAVSKGQPTDQGDEAEQQTADLVKPEPVRHAPPPPVDTREVAGKVGTIEIQIGKPAPEANEEDFGSPLDANWSIGPEQIMLCRGEGYTSGEIAEVIDGFKRYNLAAGTLSQDWNLTWTKWWERRKPKKAKPRVQISNKAPEETDVEG